MFHDASNNTKFTHVTFADSRTAYFAMIGSKCKLNNNIKIIRPADSHQQPDNPLNSTSGSPFYNLSDDCFIQIAKYCDIEALAALSAVCEKFSDVCRTRIFAGETKFSISSNDGTDGFYELQTFSQIVSCLKPKNFHLKIFRNLNNPLDGDYFFTIDLNANKTEFSTETKILDLEVLHEIRPIALRITAINLYQTIYDDELLVNSSIDSGSEYESDTDVDADFDHKPRPVFIRKKHVASDAESDTEYELDSDCASDTCVEDDVACSDEISVLCKELIPLPKIEYAEIPFPNVKMLTISGYSSSCRATISYDILRALPNVELLVFRSLKTDCNGIKPLLARTTFLREITFENCLFEPAIESKQLIEVASAVKAMKQMIPLCMRFDRIHGSDVSVESAGYEEIKKVKAHLLRL